MLNQSRAEAPLRRPGNTLDGSPTMRFERLQVPSLKLPLGKMELGRFPAANTKS